MEFYSDDTPATRLFQNKSIVLAGERKQDKETRLWGPSDEVILYANYHWETKSVTLDVYDNAANRYLFKSDAITTYTSAYTRLHTLNAEYPGKIKLTSFLPDMELFFKAVENSVYVEDRVTDTNHSCDQCQDWNRDEFIFLYVPAVPGTKLDEASLGLHWDYGCFGGTKVAGDFDYVMEEVRGTLTEMLARADDEYKISVQGALDTLPVEV